MAKKTCKTIQTQIYRYKTIIVYVERYKTCILCDSVTHWTDPSLSPTLKMLPFWGSNRIFIYSLNGVSYLKKVNMRSSIL